MQNYVGLKRSRTYQITETEEVIGINEKGYIVIETQKINSRSGDVSKNIRMVTPDGNNVKVIETNSCVRLPKKENDGGWDNTWPDELSNPKTEKKIYYAIP